MHFPTCKTLFCLTLMGTSAIAAPSAPVSVLEKRAGVCPPMPYRDLGLAAYFLQHTPAFSPTELAKAAANVTFQTQLPGGGLGLFPSPPMPVPAPIVEVDAGKQFLGIFVDFIMRCGKSKDAKSAPCNTLVYGIVKRDLEFMVKQPGSFSVALDMAIKDVNADPTKAKVNPAVQTLVDSVGTVLSPTILAGIGFLKFDVAAAARSEAIYFSTFISVVKATVADPAVCPVPKPM
ncbi:hypothetical protein AA313_de0209299 [Arthrobotrys entomopaga]|nr:hypothetical protein AA313_de0209299 [Arthrobotrys entomopaga]